MPNENDKRVRKTRALLRHALEQLLMEKPLHGITVKELCARCEINRGTFYLHYADVPGLLQAVEKETLDGFEAVLARVRAEQPLPSAMGDVPTTAFIRFMAENAGICRVLLCRNVDMQFVERIKEIARVQFMGGWPWPVAGDARGTAEYTFAFVAEGCIGMLRCWLENNMALPEKEMALLLRTIPARGAAAMQAM